MELLFDSAPKNTLSVGETKVHGGGTFTVDDAVGEQLLATPAYHCRLPGPEPEPQAPKQPRGRRRIPDNVPPPPVLDPPAEDPAPAGPGVETPPDPPTA